MTVPTPDLAADQGRIYADAKGYMDALARVEEQAATEMLAAWSESYWSIRRELDTLLAKVANARAEGRPVSVSWLYRERRLEQLLTTAQRSVAQYAGVVASMAEEVQRVAADYGQTTAQSLLRDAVAEGLPGLDVTMADVNPAVVRSVVGFLGDGTVLREHLAATLPGEVADAIRSTLVTGLAGGRSGDWMVREVTRGLGIAADRAETIIRTESLRAYRHASRETYMANADVVGTWVWTAKLDARSCAACIAMHGTEHPVDAVLDGHPRCRCTMVPRTPSWEDILGPELAAGEEWPDTRPKVVKGTDWLAAQSERTQRAIMGPAKWQAWKDGELTLDDLVARTRDPQWGTMRTERSLAAIRDGRHANWTDRGRLRHPWE